MKKSKPEARDATVEEIKGFLNLDTTPTLRGWVAVNDGKIVAAWGFMLILGRWYLFMDLSNEVRPFKKFILKTAKESLIEAAKMGIKRLHAYWDKSEPTGARFMEHMGFVDRGPYFVWRAE